MRCVWFLVLHGAVILTACSSGSKRRVCEPVLQTGCPAGESCGLDADGVPACAPVGAGVEGSACTVADDCAAGLGCIRVRGVSRCLRFCEPSDTDETCGDEPGDHPYSGNARCIGAAVDRADIGICVLPCTPADPQCPAGTACGLVSEAGIAMCQPAGELQGGAQCDGRRLCAEGLGCVPHGDRFVCRPYAVGDCTAGTVRISVPGIYDPVADDEVRVCATCVTIGRLGADGEVVTACPPAAPANVLCAAEGGEAPRLLDLEHAERFDRAVPFDGAWWTGARISDSGWIWPDGTKVEAALVPSGAGDCAVWNAGAHEARDCGGEAAAVCALASGGVGE